MGIKRFWIRRRPAEAALEKEMQFHLAAQAAAEQAAGASVSEAARRAALALGGVDGIKEACREARPGQWLEELARDVRYGLRQWRRQPGFAAVVLATLGLGIAATTVMVSLVHGVLLKPLAFAHPDRIVSVQEQTAGAPNATAIAEGWGRIWAVAYPNYADLLAASRTLELGAWTTGGDLISAPGDADYVDSAEVTASLFPLLGVHPIAGRGFLPQDDRPGAPPVALVSAALASQRFGAAAAALGGRIVFGGQPYTVIGVMPPGFDLRGYTTADAADVYTPLGQDRSPQLQDRRRHMLGVAARLRPGATLLQARGELDVIARRLQARYPQSNAERDFLVQPWRADVGDAATSIWLLLAAAGLVLLIACANIAGLLLTRALSREPEMAMRAALGAGRSRLVRQCLAESALYGLGGAGLGVALAAAGLRPFLALWPGGLPRAAEVGLDPAVLLTTVALALVCSLGFGLVPAWRLRRQRPVAVLRTEGRARSHARWHGGFVMAEVGLAVVLLVAAGLLGRAMLRLSALDLGVNPRNVLTGRVALPDALLANPAATRAAWDALLTRVRQLPAVVAAATVDTVPLREGNDTLNYWTGAAAPPQEQQPTALATTAGDGYFQALGIPLRRGRFIDARDRMSTAPVAVIDDVLARHAFAGRDPVGQQIHLGLGNDPLTIVGVVGHVRYWGPAGDDASPVRDQVYYAFAQLPDRYVRRWSQLMSITVRTSVPPAGMVSQVEAAVRGAGGDAAFYEVRTLEQLAHGALDQQRFLLSLFTVFSALALLLASLGVYGVQSFLAAERMPELGVRAALGATRARIFWTVVRQSLGQVAIGVVIGSVAAWAAAGAVHRAVAGVGGAEPLTLAVVALLLLAAAAAASLPPARRASRVDPMLTLRQL